MVDHEKLQPEEITNRNLVRELQNVYRFRPEEEQVLARVQKRLEQHAQALSTQETVEATSTRSSLHPTLLAEHSLQRSSRKPRPHFLNTLAATLVVGIIVGSLVLTFSVIHRGASSSHLASSTPSQIASSTPIPFPISNAPVKNGFWIAEGIRLKMFTLQAGWALGDSQQGPYDRILHTVDGGHSWQDITPTSYLSSPTYSDGDFYVLDENTAWVPLFNSHPSSPETEQLAGLLRTIDGGKTWQAMTLIEKQTDPKITFINPNDGWQLVNTIISKPGTTTIPSSERSVLYHTHDGGKTWQTIGTLPATFTLYMEANDIHFLNNQIGWATMISPAYRTVLFATRDSGKTWTEQSLPVPPGNTGASLESVSLLNFVNASTWYLLVGRNNGSYVYRTQDAGNSWQIVGNAIPVPNMSNFGGMLDAQHGIADNMANFMLLTLVNNHWTAYNLTLPEAEGNQNLLQASFLSPQKGFILITTPENRLDFYQTTDGGKTWIALGSLPVAK